MQEDNLIVNGLWIGARLSQLEILTIKSFLANGHQFRLWLYDELENQLPEDVEVMDAGKIIPSNQVFSYKNSNSFGHGKGSVSGFSDIFRYKLLYDEGGWWVDMDVTCLQPLNVRAPYYFRPHHDLLLVGNVMKCPRKSELMLKCYEEASSMVDENNTDWHKPIEILVNNVKALKLESYIVSGHSTQDKWNVLRKYLYSGKKLKKNWIFIHWMNEEWRSRGLDKDDFMISSAYGKLLLNHQLMEANFTLSKRLKNRFRFLFKRLIE